MSSTGDSLSKKYQKKTDQNITRKRTTRRHFPKKKTYGKKINLKDLNKKDNIELLEKITGHTVEYE